MPSKHVEKRLKGNSEENVQYEMMVPFRKGEYREKVTLDNLKEDNAKNDDKKINLKIWF